MEMDHGEEREIKMSDGSHITLKALARDFDPSDRKAAAMQLLESNSSQKILTGLIYVNPKADLFTDQLGLIDTPLSLLTEKETRPSKDVLKQIMDDLA
jgi:2-oxoglutarate ferredoxin oxidoreductase subunit beta